jgi:PAS domain S-box-containing protein
MKTKQQKLDRFSTLLDNSADITFIIDAESGRIEDVNEGVEKILGYKSQELTGTLFRELIASDEFSEQSVESWFESEQPKNGRYVAELNFVDYQDNRPCLECNFTKEDDKWFVSASDIRDQKEAEKRVSELKDKFKKAV